MTKKLNRIWVVMHKGEPLRSGGIGRIEAFKTKREADDMWGGTKDFTIKKVEF